jgi:hypothetical protein
MGFYIGVHDVARVDVSANGGVLERAPSEMHWWQQLRFYDPHGAQLGEITLHLADCTAALPIGDQPPYWGIDVNCPAALAVIDGESPF